MMGTLSTDSPFTARTSGNSCGGNGVLVSARSRWSEGDQRVVASSPGPMPNNLRAMGLKSLKRPFRSATTTPSLIPASTVCRIIRCRSSSASARERPVTSCRMIHNERTTMAMNSGVTNVATVKSRSDVTSESWRAWSRFWLSSTWIAWIRCRISAMSCRPSSVFTILSASSKPCCGSDWRKRIVRSSSAIFCCARMRERRQTRLVGGIPVRPHAQLFEQGVDRGFGRGKRLQVPRVARQQIAALARFEIIQVGQQRDERLEHLLALTRRLGERDEFARRLITEPAHDKERNESQCERRGDFLRRGEPHGGLVPGSGRRPGSRLKGGSGEGGLSRRRNASLCLQKVCRFGARGIQDPPACRQIRHTGGKVCRICVSNTGNEDCRKVSACQFQAIRPVRAGRCRFSSYVAVRRRRVGRADGSRLGHDAADVVEQLVEIDGFFQDGGNSLDEHARRSMPRLCEPVSINTGICAVAGFNRSRLTSWTPSSSGRTLSSRIRSGTASTAVAKPSRPLALNRTRAEGREPPLVDPRDARVILDAENCERPVRRVRRGERRTPCRDHKAAP